MADNTMSTVLYIETNKGYTEVNTIESPLPLASNVGCLSE